MATVAEKMTQAVEDLAAFRDDFGARLGELERRAARETGVASVAGGGASLASQIMANRDFGSFDYDSRSRQRINLNGGLSEAMASITSAPATVGDNTSPGTSLVPGMRVPGFVVPPNRKMTIRDLIASGVTGSNVVEWAEETSFSNNAAMQSEGETKASSDLTFELRSAPVRTLAHTFTASKQILDDAQGLASYIGNRGVTGLELVEEMQILRGDGTGINLDGILPQATDFNTSLLKAGDTDEYAYLRRAIQQIRLTERRANGILLHPNAAADMDLLRETDSGKYWIDPAMGGTGSAWRLPVIESTAIAEDEFAVADWTAAQIFDRQQATVEISSEHADYFARNLLMIRVEERLALAVYEPAAFVLGTFGASSGT